MAIVTVEEIDKCGEFLSRFYPVTNCTGSCELCYDPGTGWYHPCPGQDVVCGACTCASIPPSLVRLLRLKGFSPAVKMSRPCTAKGLAPPEPVILELIELLLRLRFVTRLAIGLGVLSAMLLTAVVYLLLR